MLHVALCHAKHIRILVGLRPFLHELSSRALHNLCICSLHSCLEQLWTWSTRMRWSANMSSCHQTNSSARSRPRQPKEGRSRWFAWRVFSHIYTALDEPRINRPQALEAITNISKNNRINSKGFRVKTSACDADGQKIEWLSLFYDGNGQPDMHSVSHIRP
jgi:hypothetical protein